MRCDGPVSELFWSASRVRLLLYSQADRHTPLDMGIPHKKHCEIHNPNEHAHEHASMCTITQTSTEYELIVYSCSTRDHRKYCAILGIFLYGADIQYGHMPRVNKPKLCTKQQRQQKFHPYVCHIPASQQALLVFSLSLNLMKIIINLPLDKS